jgi:hypothetical protein
MRKQGILINNEEIMINSSLLTKDENGIEYPKDCYLAEMENGMYIPDTVKLLEKASQDLTKHVSKIVQNHLDTTATDWGYDTIYTAIGYVGDPDPTFNSEGTMFRNWRSAVWVYVNEEKAKLINGQRTLPTDSEMLAELPLLEAYA